MNSEFQKYIKLWELANQYIQIPSNKTELDVQLVIKSIVEEESSEQKHEMNVTVADRDYTIGEVAKMLGVKVAALKKLEREKKLPKPKRNRENSRIYNVSDINVIIQKMGLDIIISPKNDKAIEVEVDSSGDPHYKFEEEEAFSHSEEPAEEPVAEDAEEDVEAADDYW